MKPIPEYEGIYTIDEYGTVMRVETHRVLAPCINKQTGYLYVGLWKNNVGRTFSVHRLVARVYVPNPDNKPHVNHRNSERLDNHAGNLEWCTQQENMQHAYQEGFMSQEARRNFKEFDLEMLLQAFLAGESMTSLALGAEVGLSRLTINVRRKARELGKEGLFDAEIYRQRCIRNKQSNIDKQMPILQFTPEGIFIAEHISMTAAAKAIGASSSGSINNALNPNMKQRLAYGYLWKFK